MIHEWFWRTAVMVLALLLAYMAHTQKQQGETIRSQQQQIRDLWVAIRGRK